MFFGDYHDGEEAVVGHRDAYWASGRSAVTNSLLLSVLWVVGTFGADRNVQHWAEPCRGVAEFPSPLSKWTKVPRIEQVQLVICMDEMMKRQQWSL